MSVHESFEGRAVLITGAATSIGRATMLAFARAGAMLVLGEVAAPVRHADDTPAGA